MPPEDWSGYWAAVVMLAVLASITGMGFGMFPQLGAPIGFPAECHVSLLPLVRAGDPVGPADFALYRGSESASACMLALY